MWRNGDKPIEGYTLIGPIGKGTFGEVWEARGPGGVHVALKFIALTGVQGLKEYRGIQRVKQIGHANLMPINGIWALDQENYLLSEAALAALEANYGSARDGAHGTMMVEHSIPTTLVVAMPLGEKSLWKYFTELREAGRLFPLDELLIYIEDAARGIDHLNKPIHDLGGPERVAIQHCDIKPANIMLMGQSAQICDFGLAHVLDREGARMTSAGQALGTYAYMSPECAAGEPTGASDQYSLAITYYEMRTGTLPFTESDKKSALRLIDAHARGRLDLSELEPGEREVIRKATSVKPGQRYSTALEMVHSLREAVQFESRRATPPPLPPRTAPPTPASSRRSSVNSQPPLAPTADGPGHLTLAPTACDTEPELERDIRITERQTAGAKKRRREKALYMLACAALAGLVLAVLFGVLPNPLEPGLPPTPIDSPQPSSDAAQQLFDRARTNFDHGDWRIAFENSESLILLKPKADLYQKALEIRRESLRRILDQGEEQLAVSGDGVDVAKLQEPFAYVSERLKLSPSAEDQALRRAALLGKARAAARGGDLWSDVRSDLAEAGIDANRPDAPLPFPQPQAAARARAILFLAQARQADGEAQAALPYLGSLAAVEDWENLLDPWEHRQAEAAKDNMFSALEPIFGRLDQSEQDLFRRIWPDAESKVRLKAHLAQADQYRSQGRFGDALRELKSAEGLAPAGSPDRRRVDAKRALVLLKDPRANTDQALGALAALTLPTGDPQWDEIRRALVERFDVEGVALSQVGRALELLEELFEKSPGAARNREADFANDLAPLLARRVLARLSQSSSETGYYGKLLADCELLRKGGYDGPWQAVIDACWVEARLQTSQPQTEFWSTARVLAGQTNAESPAGAHDAYLGYRRFVCGLVEEADPTGDVEQAAEFLVQAFQNASPAAVAYDALRSAAAGRILMKAAKEKLPFDPAALRPAISTADAEAALRYLTQPPLAAIADAELSKHLALASWYHAPRLVDEALRAVNAVPESELSLPLLLVRAEAHAQLASADPNHRNEAIRSYGRILDELDAFDRTHATIRDAEIFDEVVAPGLKLVAEFPGATGNKDLHRALADLWGMKGVLAHRSWDVERKLPSDNVPQLVYNALQTANRLGRRPEFLVNEGEAFVALPGKKPEDQFAELARLASEALALDANYHGAYGLLGHALIHKARLSASRSDKLTELEKAASGYEKALKAIEPGAAGALASARASYLVGRSMSRLEKAFLQRRDRAACKPLLEAAARDAQEAEQLAGAYFRPEDIYNAYGNALEDKALYLGEDTYDDAVKKFQAAAQAAKDRLRSPGQSLMNQGRCQCRYATLGNAGRDKHRVLREALIALDAAAKELKSAPALAQTHYWISQVHLNLSPFEADAAGRSSHLELAHGAIVKAVQGAQESDRANWANYQAALIEIAVHRKAKQDVERGLDELLRVAKLTSPQTPVDPERLVHVIDLYIGGKFGSATDELKRTERALACIAEGASTDPYRARLLNLESLVIYLARESLWSDYGSRARKDAETAHALASELSDNATLDEPYRKESLLAQACLRRYLIDAYEGDRLLQAKEFAKAEALLKAAFAFARQAVDKDQHVSKSYMHRYFAANFALGVDDCRIRAARPLDQPARQLLTAARDLVKAVVENKSLVGDPAYYDASTNFLTEIERRLR